MAASQSRTGMAPTLWCLSDAPIKNRHDKLVIRECFPLLRRLPDEAVERLRNAGKTITVEDWIRTILPAHHLILSCAAHP
ncbi:hypothetical protein [Kistimonas scapharcae]|uniref:hypothetical protein n=1 Tax=Kistimonas scapharcae TaxID=1036133 RepID=UPI0031EA98B9